MEKIKHNNNNRIFPHSRQKLLKTISITILLLLFTIIIIAFFILNKADLIFTLIKSKRDLYADFPELEFNIEFPKNDRIYGAGLMYFKFNITYKENDTIKALNVSYAPIKIFIDDELLTSTFDLTYQYYQTTVKYYTLTAVTELNNNKIEAKSVRFGITKKGIGVNDTMGQKLNISELNIGWYFNWGKKRSPDPKYDGYDFVPTLLCEDDPVEAEEDIDDLIKLNYTYVLLFNEPENSSVCNTTLDHVVDIYEKSFRNKNIIMSAPMTHVWPADCDWIRNWTHKCSIYDFYALHIFPDNYGGVEMAEWFANTVVDETFYNYGKPIWITEFSTIGLSMNESKTIEFYRAIIPMLNSRDYVIRYSPLNMDNEKYTLWNSSSGKLTNVGKVFAEVGNPQ